MTASERIWHVYSEDGIVLARARPVGPRLPAAPRGARVERSADGKWVEVYGRKQVPQPQVVYVSLGGPLAERRNPVR